MTSERRFHRTVLYAAILLILAVSTTGVYFQVRNFEFINFDDEDYVVKNRYVQNGLTLGTLRWAFTAFHAGNWHPLTWLSHAMDCDLFGMNPGSHHVMNLIFHLANTLLLFIVLEKITGELLLSGLTAALFAIHPLHVESVAWISERKDVLSAFFLMLTLLSYSYYVSRQTLLRYGWVLFFFMCGLMSKPMLVTLPFILLLLDYWPLRRIDAWVKEPRALDSKTIAVILEKIPLVCLCILSSVITVLAQRKGGAVSSFVLHPFPLRIENAVNSYVRYLEKTFIPTQLSVYYPYPGSYPLWQTIGSFMILVSITAIAVLKRRNYPWLIVGWFWYIGTLVPVIGIVQVGSQAMADRYSYIPLIGIFIVMVWGLNVIFNRLKVHRIIPITLIIASFMVLGSLTWIQVQYWENSIRLFTRTLETTQRNSVAHNNLGAALGVQGRVAEAMHHFSEAVRFGPDNKEAFHNYGFANELMGNYSEAAACYREALFLSSNFRKAHISLGKLLARQGDAETALFHFNEALRLDSRSPEVLNEMGVILANQGHLKEAISLFQEALTISPDDVDAKNNLAVALINFGNLDGAIRLFREVLEKHPNNELAQKNLKMALEDKAAQNSAQ